MTLLFLILFLHFFFVWLYGDKKLYCGLFGGCFNRPIDKAILDKLITLGFVNQSRGEDGCGYYNGETVYKGTGDEKRRFADLFIREGLMYPEQDTNNVFIGHVRKATRGDKTDKNTHPFETDSIVVAHNGTIDNIWSLTNKHGINTAQIFSDSLGLTLLLEKVGYKILDNYEGYAALLIHKKEEPNILYIYHGASKSYEKGDEVEERPLFYLEDEEGIYVSSMKEALELIRTSDDIPVNIVPHNSVIQLKNGKKTGLSYPVNRGNANVKVAYNRYYEAWDDVPQRTTLIPAKTHYQSSKPPVSNSTGYYTYLPFESYTDIAGINIYEETPDVTNPNINIDEMLYYHQGRYYITKPEFKDELATGMYIVNKDGKILTLFDIKKAPESEKARHMYFYKGVLLKSQNCYNTITSILNSGDKSSKDYKGLVDNYYNFAYCISKYAKYPVTCLPSEGINCGNVIKTVWWMDDNWCNGEYEPVFSNRKYKFKSGLLIKISAKSKEDTGIIPSKSLKAIIKTENNSVDDTFNNIISGVFKNGQIKVKKSDSEISDTCVKFFTVYRTVENGIESLGDVGLCTLSLYAEKIFETIFGCDEPSEKMVENLSLSIIRDAVEKRTTLIKVMDTNTLELEKFIGSAIAIVEQESKQEEEYDIDAEQPIIDTLPDLQSRKDSTQLSLLNDPNFKLLNNNTLEENEQQIIELEKKQEEDDRAATLSDEILSQLNDLWKTAMECQLLNHSDFAQDVCQKVCINIDKMQQELKEVFRKHKQSELVLKTNKQISNIF